MFGHALNMEHYPRMPFYHAPPFMNNHSNPYRQQPHFNYMQPQWNQPPNWNQNQPPLSPNYPNYYPVQQPPWPQMQQPYGGNVSETIFQNPLQPNEEANPYFHANLGGMPFMHQYPKQSLNQPAPSGMQSVLNSFKTQDGSLDFNKMMDTAGSMMNAVSQVSSMVKGLGGMLKA